MMRSDFDIRLGLMLVVLTLIVTSCDSGEDTTTAGEATTTTDGFTATAGAAPQIDVHACTDTSITDRFLFVVRAEEAGAVDESVGMQVSPASFGRYVEEGDLPPFEALEELVTYFVVTDADLLESDSPALEAVNVLRGDGIDARPVYGMAFAGHWTMEPGGEPPRVWADRPPQTTRDPAIGEGMSVAIVDRGFLENGSPTTGDIESVQGLQEIDPTGVVSTPGDNFHGSFVRNIISGIAPGATITYESVPLVGKPSYPEASPAPTWLYHQTVEKADTPDTPAVAAAIVAAVGGDLSSPQSQILNLSLGTYACPFVNDDSDEPVDVLPPLEIELVLDELDQSGVEIVAAGGNEVLPPELVTAFYPAAFDFVTGVGPYNSEDDDVAWESWGISGRAVGASGVSGPIRAPGIDLIALYTSDGDPISWSGSSFATAVVSGMKAAKNADAEASPPYEDVVGLCWVDADGDIKGEC